MAYSDNTYTADAINSLSGLLAGAIEAQAMRPQKTSVFTSSTSTPYALNDMIANRNRIGRATTELNDALKAREDLGYTLASALSGIPQQQGAGSWLSDFARAFGGGMAAPTNARVDRAQKKYEAEMKDLANILAFDKAMGETQQQQQTIGYTPMEYGTAGKQAAGSAGAQQQEVPVITPQYWDEMIKNYDADRPDEASYRNQTQVARNISNSLTFAGTKNEAYARDVLYSGIKGRKFMPMVRSALKGGGQISDYEDKKYSQWLENAPDDPVGLKDVAVMIVNDYSTNHGLSPLQKNQILESLGLTSEKTQLLPQQIKYEPERVKSEEKAIDSILQEFNASRVD